MKAVQMQKADKTNRRNFVGNAVVALAGISIIPGYKKEPKYSGINY
jgi:hypothetical protein